MVFRINQKNPEGAWILVADAGCKICRGSGCVTQRHGSLGSEQMDCDCVFESSDPEVVESIDAGAAFIVEPSPNYIKQMEMVHESDEMPF